MKKSFLSFLTTFLVVTFFFVGCKKPNTTEPPPTTTTPKTTQPIPTFSGTVDRVVVAIHFTYTEPSVPEPYNKVEMNMGYAKFGDISGTGTDAGTVTLNGKTIAKTTANSSVDYNSFTSFTTLDLNWDGNPHSWSVTGAGNTPAFTIGVTSPTAFTLSNPTATTVAPKTSALNVTWSGAYSTAPDSVMIVLVVGSTTFTATTTNKTGSYSIPASQLSAMAGDAILQVVKYRYATKTVSSKNFVGVAEIVAMVNFKIQ
ncbi:MAG: hypothetical protein M0Q21_05805 [Ignavibacteriaceae bacterium]|nr:hypothetical protein [Ignavibacteriaceae bacterium]